MEDKTIMAKSNDDLIHEATIEGMKSDGVLWDKSVPVDLPTGLLNPPIEQDTPETYMLGGTLKKLASKKLSGKGTKKQEVPKEVQKLKEANIAPTETGEIRSGKDFGKDFGAFANLVDEKPTADTSQSEHGLNT